MEHFSVLLEGFSVIDDFEGIEEKIAKRVSQAINRTAMKTRTSSKKAIMAEVNYKASELVSHSGGLLSMPKKASVSSPYSIIKGRFRPTSLARFQYGVSKKNLKFKVKRGGAAKEVRGAFKFGGQRGQGGPKTNALIAVRLEPGQTVSYGKRIKTNQWTDKYGRRFDFLYGPSVNQVFRGVLPDQIDPAADALQKETLRLIGLDGIFT